MFKYFSDVGSRVDSINTSHMNYLPTTTRLDWAFCCRKTQLVKIMRERSRYVIYI
jgi:hypothetical protein